MNIMIRNKLYRKLIGISDYIDKLYYQDYFNNASEIAISSYKIFIKYLIEHFDLIEVSFYNKLYRYIILNYIPDLRYVQRANTSNIPWSLVPNLDEILKNELGNDCMLLFRPQWKFNYSVHMNDLIQDLINLLCLIYPTQIDEITSLFQTKRIHIFSFPLLEKTNVLLNSIIGHEIGHFCHREWVKSDYAKSKFEEFNTKLAEYYRAEYPKELLKPYEMTTEGIKIIEGMYREIIPDIYGYKIFGPSVMFALYEIAFPEEEMVIPSKINQYYPLTKYRIRFLYTHLFKKDKEINKLLSKDDKCIIILKEYIEQIEKYLAIKDDVTILSTIFTETSLFESTSDDIISYVNNHISKKYFDTNNTIELYNKLIKQLPINELDETRNDISQIIFVGWIRYFELNTLHNEEEYVIQYQILMKLLLKSLYSSYVQSIYKKEL
jgi:hypothetical protein